MKIRDIIDHLELTAPPNYQESYDNSRLLTGDAMASCTGALICLDSIEAVIDEAVDLDCNLVIAHHPIVFSGIKSLTGKNYVERTIIKAIRNNIAIYACHTNLDNVPTGVNSIIANKLGLENVRILSPKKGLLRKLYTYVPASHSELVLQALFEAGGGNIGNYSECSFSHDGAGTFKGGSGTSPFVGEAGKRHRESEKKLEVVFTVGKEHSLISALKKAHPYEEVAYEIVALENSLQDVGSGMIGDLPEDMPIMKFLNTVKTRMKTGCIRYTDPVAESVKRIAICGGAGSFLLEDAVRAGADVFITGDYKYHQFFDADSRIVIADIGHYESERYTSELIYGILSQKFGNFALHLSKVETNPINYL
ncbi:MAG: Nif3-like dinuclear metal center hexameric protein [Bacteroidetes bacterium]|nr:Nif3-like dinuclear metal center hexameric protein [Bacteroidota bacterium]